jgi:AraC family transcriptional regulator
MLIYIKNMVCIRCVMAVRSVLQTMGIRFHSIELGKVQLAENLGSDTLHNLNKALSHYELELMNGRRQILAERIRTLIIEKLHSPQIEEGFRFSEFLSNQLNYDYTYLANVFSETEGCTIEKYYIIQKVERVKELLLYEGMTVTDIAYLLNYSSVGHLCRQFKKLTGQTPAKFKDNCESEDYIWRKLPRASNTETHHQELASASRGFSGAD